MRLLLCRARNPERRWLLRGSGKTLLDDMSFDLVIFDCDGVLVDSELISCRCLIETLRGYGIETTLEEVFATFLGRSTRSIADHYRAAGLRIPDDFPAELRARVRRAFADELRPIANIEMVLRRLAALYCVASSSDLDRVEFSLALTGLSELFSGRIFTAQMVANGKPAPDLFLYAAAEMKAAPLTRPHLRDDGDERWSKPKQAGTPDHGRHDGTRGRPAGHAGAGPAWRRHARCRRCQGVSFHPRCDGRNVRHRRTHAADRARDGGSSHSQTPRLHLAAHHGSGESRNHAKCSWSPWRALTFEGPWHVCRTLRAKGPSHDSGVRRGVDRSVRRST